MNKYYVYRHVRLDTNQVFYIGKGCGKRAFNKSNRNQYWKNIVNKTDYTIKIMLDNLTHEQALLKEIELISLYRKCSQLANLTDGGDGNLGTSYPCSEEKKLRLSIISKNMSAETKLKMSLAKKGKPGNKKGTKISEAGRLNMSKAKIGNSSKRGTKLSEDAKKKMSTIHLNRVRVYSEETRKKLSAAAHKRWSTKCPE